MGCSAKESSRGFSMLLACIQNAARLLVTLDEKDPLRTFEGEALLRMMNMVWPLGRKPDGPDRLWQKKNKKN